MVVGVPTLLNIGVRGCILNALESSQALLVCWHVINIKGCIFLHHKLVSDVETKDKQCA